MEVFECKKCGQCCEGTGGIVLSSYDIERLAKFLFLSENKFRELYTENQQSKIRIQSVDGYCVFFKKGKGCAVHEAKPDICRAWPFFKGNLLDRESFFLAKDYCNGIEKSCGFEDFVKIGYKYLQQNGLLDHLEKGSAESLKL